MRVLCKLPNAGEHINGVAFEPTDGGWLSEPVAPEVAEHFGRIPGYQVITEAAPALPRTPAKPPPAGKAAG